jgi:hypothetical protein
VERLSATVVPTLGTLVLIATATRVTTGGIGWQ